MVKTAETKARELLSSLSLDEKIYQLCCQMVYPIIDDYYSKRNYKVGNCRNNGHFLHERKGGTVSPAEVTEEINKEICCAIESNSHAIPPLEHGGSKAKFMKDVLGYSQSDSKAFHKNVVASLVGKTPTKSETTPFGTKHTYNTKITGKDGKSVSANVVVVIQKDNGRITHKIVTVYPDKKGK